MIPINHVLINNSIENRKKKELDLSVTAFRVVQESTVQIIPKPTKNKTFNAVALEHIRVG